MLEIYKSLFEDLNSQEVQYCVYKGLAHLEKDLNGDRGDIDILLNKNDIDKFDSIALDNNFFKVQKKDKPYYYLGIDKVTHKFVMLDIDTQIKCGEKPYKPYSFNIEFDKLSIITKFNSVKILNPIDYTPLMFIVKIISSSEKIEDLKELKELIKRYKTPTSYFSDILKESFSLNWDIISEDILKSEDWQNLRQKYFLVILQNIEKNSILAFKQKYKKVFGKLKAVRRRLFQSPPYQIRNKGYLVAFVGVDGAGKSSTVDFVKNLDFFKFTGVKRIYFGSNEYWIPGLLWMIMKEYNNRYIRLLISTLVSIDKQLRILRALYYMHLGNIVLADRYFYDDEIGKEMNKNIPRQKSLLRTIYRFLFEIRMHKKPDLTIFLDVSPEVAYSRKQDYSYEKMLEVNKAYKDYMYKVDGVKIINADATQSKIYEEVVQSILNLDKDR